MGIDALDQRMSKPLADRPVAPLGGLLLFDLIGAAVAFGQRYQSLSGIVAPVEDDVLTSLTQFAVDLIIDVKLPGA